MKYTVHFNKDGGNDADRPVPDVNFFGNQGEDFTESYNQGLDYAKQVENKIRTGDEAGEGEKKQKRDKLRRAAEAIEAYTSAGESTDLLGSYTGITEETREKADVIIPRTENGKVYMDLNASGSVPADYIGDINNPEIPVQDADDL